MSTRSGIQSVRNMLGDEVEALDQAVLDAVSRGLWLAIQEPRDETAIAAADREFRELCSAFERAIARRDGLSIDAVRRMAEEPCPGEPTDREMLRSFAARFAKAWGIPVDEAVRRVEEALERERAMLPDEE